MAWRKRVKGRPVSEFLSSQLLLPGRRCSAWHHEGGEESPRGLTREGSSRGSEGNQGEKSVARMSAPLPHSLGQWPFCPGPKWCCLWQLHPPWPDNPSATFHSLQSTSTPAALSLPPPLAAR